MFEQDKIEFAVDADGYCADQSMESSTADVEQTKLTVYPLQKDKQVQVEPLIEKVKLFTTTGTQTDDFVIHRVTKMHPDDINVLCHLEDHNYSLGPNNYDVTDVEPCTTTCTPEPKDQSLLAECDVIHNKMNVDETNPVLSDDADDDALSDSGSLYCPSVSDDALEQTTNFLVVPHLLQKKNLLCLKVNYINCLQNVMIVVVLSTVQLRNAMEVW